MDHAPGFLKAVNESKPAVREITIEEARKRLAASQATVLMDVREDSEWSLGHATEAIHLGKGVLERDLERTLPNTSTEILMYCGGGYRSILAAHAAQKMGYLNVFSIAGGYKAMLGAGWSIKQESI